MKLLATSGLLALVVFAVGFAQAQEKKDPCAEAQSQAEMNMCWGKEHKAADAKLNAAFRQFMAKLNDEEKAQLKKAQLAWIAYRDANCEFVADQYKGGTMRPMIAAICLAETTNNRTTELKAQMKEREQ
jgi:uncharacterized protein YecT (DUF1311 family)